MIKNKSCKASLNIITQNKRIHHKYFIKQDFEAGLALQGWEIKSLRAGKVNISDSYIMLNQGEAYMFGATLQPLIVASSHIACDPMRTRKLLLNKHELDLLSGKISREGYTVVALSLYWQNAWVKVRIGIAKGKTLFDKRTDIKEREWLLDKARIMKYNNR